MDKNLSGKVKAVRAHRLESEGPHCRVGEMLLARTREGRQICSVVEGFEENTVYSLLLQDPRLLAPGDPIFATGKPSGVSTESLRAGQILNGLGQVEASEQSTGKSALRPLRGEDLARHLAPRPTEPFRSGIRSIDVFLPVKKGSKTRVLRPGHESAVLTTMSMMARMSQADITVFGLIGQRRHALKSFFDILSPPGRAKSIVCQAPIDAHPGEQYYCPFTATAIAKYFREQGKDVLLIIDSLDVWEEAFCRLSPETQDLSLKELRGPKLSSLLDYSQEDDKGTITSFFCLEDKECERNNPGSLSRQMSSLIEGQLVFDPVLVNHNIYPPINILLSWSSACFELFSPKRWKLLKDFREVMEYFFKNRHLLQTEALKLGLSEELDEALEQVTRCLCFLRQGVYEHPDLESDLKQLEDYFANYGDRV